VRLLLVSHQFSPNANPRAVRWASLAEHWAKRGHRVDVVCGVPAGEAAEPTVGGMSVHRVGIGLVGRLRHRLGRASTSCLLAAPRQTRLRPVKRQLAAGLRMLNDLAWKPVCWPDSAGMWYGPALRTARRLFERNRYDAVITVSNPFTSHRVGLSLKRRFPTVRWIADVGDPFSVDDRVRCNNLLLYRRRNRRFEAAVLRHADATAIVTESMTRLYRRRFPESAHKLHSIQPLFNAPLDEPARPAGPPLCAGLPTPHIQDSEVRRLSYFGTLYRGFRSPAVLIETFRWLIALPRCADLQLHFYGNHSACKREFRRQADLIGTRIHLHGCLPREAALREMRDSHALVNLGNDLPYGLPSKVIEYTATGRPILNFAAITDDTSTDFLQSHPAAMTVFADDLETGRTSIAEIARFLEAPPQVSHATIDALLQPHRLESVAGAYECLLFGEANSTRRAA